MLGERGSSRRPGSTPRGRQPGREIAGPPSLRPSLRASPRDAGVARALSDPGSRSPRAAPGSAISVRGIVKVAHVLPRRPGRHRRAAAPSRCRRTTRASPSAQSGSSRGPHARRRHGRARAAHGACAARVLSSVPPCPRAAAIGRCGPSRPSADVLHRSSRDPASQPCRKSRPRAPRSAGVQACAVVSTITHDPCARTRRWPVPLGSTAPGSTAAGTGRHAPRIRSWRDPEQPSRAQARGRRGARLRGSVAGDRVRRLRSRSMFSDDDASFITGQPIASSTAAHEAIRRQRWSPRRAASASCSARRARHARARPALGAGCGPRL